MVAPEIPADSTSAGETGPPPPAAPASAPPASETTEPRFPVVGLGASAGGLEALTEFFQALPADSGLAFVVVSHLDPEHKSALGEILARITPMPVREVESPMPVEPNRVYVIPSNKGLTLAHGVLQPAPRPDVRGAHMPVDIFLRSLAEDCKAQAIGVILSGTGADGTLGLKAIKEEGGLTFAQDDTAKHTGMPRSAVAAGCVDAVLPPAEIAAELLRIARHPRQVRVSPVPAPAEQVEGDAFHQILRLLSNATGVNFLHYKHSTLRRRLERRLVLRRLQSLAEYLQCLRDDRAEVQTLFEEVLITVTSFFRDPEVFEALKTVIFPRLLEKRPVGTPVRVWVPGCATGEEAYSIAICLLEYLGARPDAPPIKIFATDISERAVEAARTGAYGESITAEVSAQRLQRFFVKTDRGYQISKTIRDLCVFARQDVTKDPPFSQLDLISCRNVLIYLGPALQNRVLPILHYALKPGGVLLLGNSETVGSFTDLFEVVDKKNRFYVRTAIPSRLTFEYSPGGGPTGGKVVLHPDTAGGGGEPGRTLADVYREADRVVLARYAPVGVVVDENLRVVQFRGDTGTCLKPAPGPPTADLLQMAREGLLGDLHAVFLRAKQDSAPVRAEGVQVRTNDHFREFHLEVIPITTPVLQARYFVVLFEEAHPAAPSPYPLPPGGEGRVRGEARVPRPRLPAPEEEAAKDQEIGRLKRELDAGKAYLQSVIEEKEASNEELRAANEEIISANEELQSTNEELETAKEELQATNEELTTVNDELQSRIRVANQLGDDLVNLIETTNIPIVVLGGDLCIRRFTPSAERVLNLRASDVGRPISELHLRVNIPDLEQLVHEVIDTLEIKQREIKDDAGAWHKLYVRPYKTLDHKIGGVVLMLIDIEALKRRERQIEESRDYAVSIVETVREPLIVLDGRLRVQTANRAFYQMFQVTPAETEGRLIYDLGGRQWNIPRLRTLLEDIVPQNSHFENFDVEHDFPKLGRRTMLLNAHRVVQREGEPGELILLAIEDITARRLAEQEAQRLARLVEASHDAIIGEAEDGTITSWNRGAERLFGYTAQEAVGQPVYMLAPADLVGEARQLRERVRQGAPVQNFETRRIRKDRREVQVSLTLSPVKDAADRVVGVALIARDITERTRAEEDLRESERRYRQLMEAMPAAVYTCDVQGHVTLYNKAAVALWGREPVLGQDRWCGSWRTYRQDGTPLPLEECPMALTLREGRSMRSEVMLERPDGTRRSVLPYPEPLFDTSGQLIGAVNMLFDITERKQAEEALREREVRLRRMMENAHVGIAFGDSQGRVVQANRTMMELVGWSEDDLNAGRLSCGALCRSEDHEQDRWAMTQLATVGRVGPAEKLLVHADGTQIPVLISAFRLDMNRDEHVTFVVDLRPQKQAEEALREREVRLRAILDTAMDAIIIIDERGVIDAVNPATVQMFGYTAAEMVGHSVNMLMPSPYREEHDGYLARYLKTGEKRVIGTSREVQARRKDGHVFSAELTVTEFQVRGQRLFTGVHRDVSARKQLEREVLDVATVEQRRIGQALHDSTGQELTALGLLAESLCEPLQEQSSELAPLAGKVKEGLARALAQVRDYARGLIPVDVDARGLHAALAELADRTSAVTGVACTLDCPDPVEVADNQAARQLYHIAQEAVTNALRHARAQHITIHLETGPQSINLRVTDDGVGLLAAPVDSKGLGLKLMHYRAGLVNGHLTIEPAKSGGTQVTCVIGKHPEATRL